MPAGRPTDYSIEFVTEFCSLLVDGTSVNTLCKRDDMPTSSTIFLWLSKHKEFSEKYAEAKEMAAEALAEEIFDIADNGSNDWMESNDNEGSAAYRLNGENIQRSRLRVDTRKWYLSKIVPKKYGDRHHVEHDISDSLSNIAARLQKAKNESRKES